MDDDFRAVLVSASYMGFFLGSIAGGIAGDWVGRLWIIYAHAIIFIPASILAACSNGMYQLLVTRFLVGLSMGALLPTCVSLVAEFSPRKQRGRAIIAIPGLAYASGVILILSVGLLLIGVCGEDGESCEWWRGMLLAGVIPDAIAIYIVLHYLEESPRFLLTRGRVEEAEESIRKIAALNETSDKLLEGGALEPLPEEDVSSESKPEKQLAHLFQPPVLNHMLIIMSSWTLLSASLFCAALIYPLVMEDQGVSTSGQYFLMIQWAAVEIPVVLLLMWLMEQSWAPRRGMIIVMGLLSTLVGVLAGLSLGSGLVWVHVTQLLFRMTAVGPYEFFYVYAAELLPTTHRNQGVSIGNGTTKFVALLLPLFMFPIYNAHHALPFYVAAAASAAAAGILIFLGTDPSADLLDVVSQVEASEETPLIKQKA